MWPYKTQQMGFLHDLLGHVKEGCPSLTEFGCTFSLLFAKLLWIAILLANIL
jgi:hypothetical protein